jgi:uncharacterized protein (DUF1330 family)
MSSYLVYICQAVKNRAGLERYWQVAPAVYPENVDVLVGYAPFEVLDADQDERVEGVVIAEFPPFEQTVEWFNGDAYVQARKDRTNGNEYLGMVVDSGVAPISKRSADMPAYVVFVCREIVDQGELNTYWQHVNETLVGHKARVLMDRGRFLILEGQGPVQGVTVYEFPTKDAARNWHNNVAYPGGPATSEKGCEISGNLGRRRGIARCATDAAHQSRWLNEAPCPAFNDLDSSA